MTAGAGTHGWAPQVGLDVPQDVKLAPHVAAMSKAPLGADTRTLLGVGLNAVLASQEMPTTELPVMVHRDRDLGLVAPCMRIPPQIPLAPFIGPLLSTVVFLISKPTPSRRMPPAVLLLTLTWSRRKIAPPSAVMPGAPVVMPRSRT